MASASLQTCELWKSSSALFDGCRRAESRSVYTPWNVEATLGSQHSACSFESTSSGGGLPLHAIGAARLTAPLFVSNGTRGPYEIEAGSALYY